MEKAEKQTHKQSAAKQKETEGERERALIGSCTLIVTNHRVAMVVQGMAHLNRAKRGRCVTVCTDSDNSKVTHLQETHPHNHHGYC